MSREKKPSTEVYEALRNKMSCTVGDIWPYWEPLWLAITGSSAMIEISFGPLEPPSREKLRRAL